MSRTIAIVEDDSDQRENYSDALESQGYVVQTYANKAQALEGFSSSLPDLAILDIMLEDEIDGGFDLCRELRQMSPQMPIIFLTALSELADKMKGFDVGGSDYVTKPFDGPELLGRVETNISLYQTRKELARVRQELKGQ